MRAAHRSRLTRASAACDTSVDNAFSMCQRLYIKPTKGKLEDLTCTSFFDAIALHAMHASYTDACAGCMSPGSNAGHGPCLKIANCPAGDSKQAGQLQLTFGVNYNHTGWDLRTNREGSCNALAGLEGSPGVGVGGNPHTEPPRQDGGGTSEKKSHSGESSVVDCWSPAHA